MSGIRTGTRLEQLHALRRTVTVQIEYLRTQGQPATQHETLLERLDQEIRNEGGTPPTPPRPLKRRRPAPAAVDVLLRELGITAHDVKVWAVQHGLLDQVRRGRVALRYVEAYAAHQRTLDHYRKAGA